MKLPDLCFIITETRKDTGRTWYVCAPPGYCRKADGTLVRDVWTKSPEWTLERQKAHRFASHRSAARVANLCPSSTIQTVTTR